MVNLGYLDSPAALILGTAGGTFVVGSVLFGAFTSLWNCYENDDCKKNVDWKEMFWYGAIAALAAGVVAGAIFFLQGHSPSALLDYGY